MEVKYYTAKDIQRMKSQGYVIVDGRLTRRKKKQEEARQQVGVGTLRPAAGETGRLGAARLVRALRRVAVEFVSDQSPVRME